MDCRFLVLLEIVSPKTAFIFVCVNCATNPTSAAQSNGSIGACADIEKAFIRSSIMKISTKPVMTIHLGYIWPVNMAVSTGLISTNCILCKLLRTAVLQCWKRRNTYTFISISPCTLLDSTKLTLLDFPFLAHKLLHVFYCLLLMILR